MIPPFRVACIAALLGACAPALVRGQEGGATLVGAVLSDSSERPIANAEIRIITLGVSARSDSAGNFTLPRIPAGTHDITVRAAGYQPLETRIRFTNGQRVEADLLMRPIVQTLGTVAVTATKSPSGNHPRIAEFDERMKLGHGHFIAQPELEKAQGRELAEVLVGKVPGLRTRVVGGKRMLYSTRGLQSIGRPICYVQVIVDDLTQGDGFDIDSIDPELIAAVEFYTVSQRPAQFNRGGNAPCGTLVIWTRY